MLFAATAFASTFAAILLLRPAAERLRLLDTPGGRKTHKAATPMVGGIGIFCGLLLASIGIADWMQQAASFLLACGILVIVGLLDDRNDIRKRVRLVAQLIATLIMVYWAGIQVDSLGNLLGTGPISLGLLAVPFTIIATMGVINATNMMDGADGLAGGLSLVALSFLAGIAFFGGRMTDAYTLLLLASSVAAFLLLNYRFPGRTRARVFLGDAGSTFLGFAICWFAISLSQGPQAVMQPIMAVWLLAIPLLDMLAVVIRRILNGQSPMAADREHIHHLLLRRGYSTTATVNLIIATALLAAALATITLGQLKVPEALMLLAFLVWVAAHVTIAQRQAIALQARERRAAPAIPTHVWTRPAANTPTPPTGKAASQGRTTAKKDLAEEVETM